MQRELALLEGRGRLSNVIILVLLQRSSIRRRQGLRDVSWMSEATEKVRNNAILHRCPCTLMCRFNALAKDYHGISTKRIVRERLLFISRHLNAHLTIRQNVILLIAILASLNIGDSDALV